ncbi:hypothetical protein DR66_1808 [Delftia acidovorans]|uniref:hypothetical protein n=1 Tax=Delftia acidovorans TaxID=80866 RepID=UPI000503E8F2|nr:hypothetical protein [Delftia acidovorans]KFJ09087.1 hypothetical protein DR66_1808 [Delftia acidovorans]QQB52044.1 hypothetical protein I6H54_07220 [Delftia acidovorans]
MKLFTSLPARKDGTLIVRIKGAIYVFEGKPLACDVENEAHAEHLRAGNFQTEEEFEAEQKFQRLAAEREARRATLDGKAPSSRGTFSPGMGSGDDDDLDGGTGMPQESDSAPTGRVRKASRASNVTG